MWNQAAEVTFGWTATEAVGRELAELIVPERYRGLHRQGLRRYLDGGETRVVSQRIEIDALHRDGHELPVELTITPLSLEGRHFFNAFLHDISDRRAAQNTALRLAALVESSEDAISSGALDGTVMSWNAGAERLYGWTEEEMVGGSIARIRPEGSLEAVLEIQAALAAGRSVSGFETQELRKDGTLIDVSVSISSLRDDEGRVVGISSIARDITDRKRAERALEDLQRRTSSAFVNAPIGMALVAADGRWLAVNAALCELLGRTEQQLLDTDFLSITHPGDVDAGLELLHEALNGTRSGYEVEMRCLRPDGSVVWVLLSMSVVRPGNGEAGYFVSHLQDITQRKQTEEELARYNEQLNQLALLDPLTGLRNLRGFHAMLEDELTRSERYATRWSVVLFDIGAGPAATNQSAGQLEAESALRAAAASLLEVSRGADLAARPGPSQLALVLPETSGEAAVRTAERVVKALGEAGAGCTANYGTASWPDDGDSTALLLIRANLRLESAKASLVPSPAEHRLERVASPTIRRMLELAKVQLGLDVTYLAEISEDAQTFRAIAGDPTPFGVTEGAKLPLSATYCRLMLRGDLPNVVADIARVPTMAAMPITSQAGVAAYVGVPVELRDGSVYGTLCAVNRVPAPELGEPQLKILRLVAQLIADQLEHEEEEAVRQRQGIELAGVHALLSALTARDQYTGKHSQTVVQLATAVARQLELSQDEIDEVEQVALLHDIGKVGIPDSILQKRGPLTEPEWELMRQHPAIGSRILAETTTLSHLAAAVKAEHERFDGTGYPDGLRADEIPLASRIGFACDAYHAMTSDRPYRKALPEPEAVDELHAGAGSQFDPLVIAALLTVIGARRPVDPRGRGSSIPRSVATTAPGLTD